MAPSRSSTSLRGHHCWDTERLFEPSLFGHCFWARMLDFFSMGARRVVPTWTELETKWRRHPWHLQHTKCLFIGVNFGSRHIRDAFVCSLSSKLAELRLPNLSHLQFFWGSIRPPTAFFVALRRLDNITQLTLYAVTLHSVGDLMRLVSGLRHLRDRRISELEWTLPTHPRGNPSQRALAAGLCKTQLRTLLSAWSTFTRDPRTAVFYIRLTVSGVT